MPFGQKQLAFAEIAACLSDMPARTKGCDDLHCRSISAAVFLHHHTIGAFWKTCPRKDSNGVTRTDFGRQFASGEALAYHAEVRTDLRVSISQRIAIHG